MLFLIIKSIVLGLILGFLYAKLFFGQLKTFLSLKLENQEKDQEKDNDLKLKRKIIFKYSSFFALSHLLLISLFIFLIWILKLNIFILATVFIFSFWCYLFMHNNF